MFSSLCPFYHVNSASHPLSPPLTGHRAGLALYGHPAEIVAHKETEDHSPGPCVKCQCRSARQCLSSSMAFPVPKTLPRQYPNSAFTEFTFETKFELRIRVSGQQGRVQRQLAAHTQVPGWGEGDRQDVGNGRSEGNRERGQISVQFEIAETDE